MRRSKLAGPNSFDRKVFISAIRINLSEFILLLKVTDDFCSILLSFTETFSKTCLHKTSNDDPFEEPLQCSSERRKIEWQVGFWATFRFVQQSTARWLCRSLLCSFLTVCTVTPHKALVWRIIEWWVFSLSTFEILWNAAPHLKGMPWHKFTNSLETLPSITTPFMGSDMPRCCFVTETYRCRPYWGNSWLKLFYWQEFILTLPYHWGHSAFDLDAG